MLEAIKQRKHAMAFKDPERRREYHRNKQREYRANPERKAEINAWRRTRAAQPENRAKVREANKKWRDEKTEHGLTKSIEWQRERRKRKPADYLLFDAKRRATKKGVPYGVSKAEHARIARVITNGVCELSGLPFASLEGTANPWSPSIDRIKPELGYVDGNVRVVVWALNMAMAGWGFDVLLRLARAIVDKAPQPDV